MFFVIVIWISVHLPLLQGETTEGNKNVLEPILNHFLVNSKEAIKSPNQTLFSLIISIADELSIIPKEFLENGLKFTLLVPTLSDVFAVGTQVIHHQHINFANGFDRILFGSLLPETLLNQSYVRSFPGSKLSVHKLSDDFVSIGNFVVDLRRYIPIFDRLVIYYKIAFQPK